MYLMIMVMKMEESIKMNDEGESHNLKDSNGLKEIHQINIYIYTLR